MDLKNIPTKMEAVTIHRLDQSTEEMELLAGNRRFKDQ
jgi:hypothetical protein